MSADTERKIDAEVLRIVKEAYQRASKCLVRLPCRQRRQYTCNSEHRCVLQPIWQRNKCAVLVFSLSAPVIPPDATFYRRLPWKLPPQTLTEP